MPPHLLPAQALFNAAPDATFPTLLASLASGNGYVVNDAGCEFPAELEPDEEPFEGVRFWLFDETVTVSTAQFIELFEAACAAQVLQVPDQATAIGPILERFRSRWSSTTRTP